MLAVMARLVVCDDDDEFTTILVSYLEKDGHAVSCCADVNQLAQLLGHEQIDLLIMDMQMPAGGGPAVTSLLKKSNAQDLPVIVCSGMPTEAQKSWCSGLLRARFMQKPIDFATMRKAIAELLAPSKTTCRGGGEARP